MGAARGLAVALVVVLAISVGASGCGGDGGSDEPAAENGSTSTVEPAAPVAPVVPSVDELGAFGETLVADTGATGGIVALSVGDAEPVVAAMGTEATEDGSAGPPIDAAAPLHVASVTKAYVAALALTLAADGTVDLDAPIATWIDWPGGDEITLRHLLTHTSGVGPFGDGESPSAFVDLVAQGEAVTLDEVLAAARDVAPVGEPGVETSYSNLGFMLAGAVLEAAAGESLADLLREQVFAPVGLDATAYPPDGLDGPAPPVGLFEFEPGVDPLATSLVPITAWQTAYGPAAGATSTVEDLLRWSDAVFRTQAIGEVDLSAMTEIGAGGVGLGVIGVGPEGDCVFDGCTTDATFDRWAMNGDFPGASTRVLHDPAADATLVVYLNRNALDLDAALIAFLDDL